MADSTVYKGDCQCGAVAFEYTYSDDTKPVFNAFCHCQMCRRSNSSSGTHLLGVPAAAFKVTKGEDNLAEYDPTEKTYRKWCKTCGAGVVQGPKGASFVATFPTNYEAVKEKFPQPVEDLFKPTMHVNMENALLVDTFKGEPGVAYYKDFPAWMGGTDQFYFYPH
jgi:hypothetical protein